jgi:hypothetical protein
MRRLTYRRGESIVDEQTDGRGDDEVAQPRSIGTDGIDRRRVDRGRYRGQFISSVASQDSGSSTTTGICRDVLR